MICLLPVAISCCLAADSAMAPAASIITQTTALAASSLISGGDHRVGEPIHQDKWPAGMADLINKNSFMHGFWVNADDFFFYTGDTAALNAMLKDYAALPGDAHLKVKLVAEAGVAESPWDKAPRGACNWRIDVINRSWRQLGLKTPPEKVTGYDVVFNVYLADGVTLNDLDAPLRAEVAVGGEIGHFIEAHRKRRIEAIENQPED